MLKVLLIHPQNYLQRRSTGIYGRSLRYAPLTMATLKALMPAEVPAEVRIVDEMVEDLDFNVAADLVGIRAISGTAGRAYEIADCFRARKVPVVMGGIHATLQTEESLDHSDSVVRGYAERTWPELIRDFAAGRMRRVYEDPLPFDSALIVAPDRTGIHRKDYLGWCTVEMSRGCSNKCEFCMSHQFHPSYVRRRIEDVLGEIKAMRSKVVFFLDPNLIGDRGHAKEFFGELAKLKKWWAGCATLDVADDPELLEIMARSGCKGLLMGFESVRPEALISSGKTKNIGRVYAETVDTIHRFGISIQACFVFGFDSDDKLVFEETSDYIINAKFDLPQISIYTPFPGTAVFRKFEEEKRILTRNWSLYNGQHAVFQPLRMTPKELEEGTNFVRTRMNSWKALSKRLLVRPLWVKPLVFMSYLSFRRYQYRIAKAGEEFVRRAAAGN